MRFIGVLCPVVLLYFFFAIAAYPTSYAVIRWNDGIVMAADSRAVNGNMRNVGDTCKLHRITRNIYSTGAGTVVAHGTNIPNLFRDAIRKKGLDTGFKDAVNTTNTMLVKDFNRDQELRNYVAQNHSALSIVIVG